LTGAWIVAAGVLVGTGVTVGTGVDVGSTSAGDACQGVGVATGGRAAGWMPAAGAGGFVTGTLPPPLGVGVGLETYTIVGPKGGTWGGGAAATLSGATAHTSSKLAASSQW
jgi:hypothetical protein